MPVVLKQVPEEERKKIAGLPAVRPHEAAFPKKARAGTAADAKREIKEWQTKQAAPEPPKNREVKLKAQEPATAQVARLAAVVESDAAPEEIIRQKFDEEQFFGTLFSSLTLYEYVRMEGEYRKRKEGPRTARNADAEWEKVVEGFRSAFANAGLEVTPQQLARYAKDLTGNKRNFEAVAKVANSRVIIESKTTEDFGLFTGLFTTVVDRFVDPNIVTTVVPDLCRVPFAEGTFTKFWSKSWPLTASIPYPCPTWTNPFRICWSTVTIATVSVNVGLNVGYKVSCCGASAWGQAYAQACGTVLGVTKCVGCTATVVGVAGFSRTPVGSQCNYGLGINASVQCSVFGATVFSASWPFGYTVTGPCPPPGLCP